MTKPCYLFDIDGTLADLTHRLHYIQKEPKDWGAFFAACIYDPPIPHVCTLATVLAFENDLVFVSGRSDLVREQTITWLIAALDGIGFIRNCDLYMRRDGDHRHDHIIKSELLDQILADGWSPIMVFEDRSQVVKMWRDRGIPCAQVADGDF